MIKSLLVVVHTTITLEDREGPYDVGAEVDATGRPIGENLRRQVEELLREGNFGIIKAEDIICTPEKGD